MGEELDINIIKSTQNSLGKYVKRPPLSEKLLKKPPFRFIHDVITSILKSTGFFKGLFEESELMSDNVKDRDSKIVFLNKIIFVIGAVTKKTLTVKPSKIIAGQEPEKTNELLQCIALALDSKLSSDDAVRRYKESVTKPASTDKKSTSIKKVIKKSGEEKLNLKSENNLNLKPKLKETRKKESPPKKSLQTLRPTPKNLAEKNKNDKNCIKLATTDPLDQSITNDVLSKVVDENSDSIQNTDVSPSLTINNTKETKHKLILPELDTTLACDNSIKQDVNKEQEPNASFGSDGKINIDENSYGNNEETNKNTIIDDNVEKLQETNVSISTNVSVTSKNKGLEENPNQTATNESKIYDDAKTVRPLSVRPSSSRPGAPRLRDKHEETLIIDSDNLLIGKVNIIAENTVQEEDEESSIVVIENDISKPRADEEIAQINSDEQHGHLVQQILDSQKEFSQVSGKTGIQWQFGAKKARDVVYQEIDQLRFNLQALSRVANPLGKLLDHIQEDVEVMRQELQHWTKTYEEAHKELQKQKKSNEEKLKPLQTKLRQLDVEISDKQDKIHDLKTNIHKNTSRIDKLLANGNKQ